MELKAMTRLLYDLCAENNIRFSPFCWRVKLALAHKRLNYQTEPVRFTEKSKLGFSGQKLVPVLNDKGTIVSDSWAIAEYLEETYPDAPTLFPGNEGKHMAKLTTEWMDGQNRELLTFIILDIFAKLNVKDQAYFRYNREERFGKSLEEVQAGREERIHEFREVNLATLRVHVTDRPFIAGQEPAYSDYAVFGSFQWARIVSDFDLLAKGDPVYNWRERMISSL